MMVYRVSRANLEIASDQVMRIWSANLPVEGPLDAKLRWFYRDGPHGPGEGFMLEATGEPVGYAGLGVRNLWFRGRPLRAALFCDLAVDRAHRSGLPALALVRASKQRALQLDLGYGIANLKAIAVFRRAGCGVLGAVQRYVRVLRSGRFLARRLSTPVAHAIGGVVDRALMLVARASALHARGARLCWLTDYDARFDALWEEARDRTGVCCERTASFLRWRFGAHPGHAYRVAALIDSRERLRAYAVIRAVDGTIEIADLFAAGPQELDAFLDQLVPGAYHLGFDALRFRYLGGPEVPRVLARHGFVRRSETRVIALAIGEGQGDRAALADSASWYLTDLDEDS